MSGRSPHPKRPGPGRTVGAMTTPRSLAEDLRQRTDEALATLLRGRPDLLHPVPSDVTALATRATTGPSVRRCLDGLDALHLHVLRTVADITAHEPAPGDLLVKDATTTIGPDASDACAGALENLTCLGLVWGEREALRSVQAVRDLIGDREAPTWPPPTLDVGALHDPAAVDAQAALHARESLGQVRDLLDDWSAHPPGVLRTGGLSLRDFAAARRSLQADWSRTSLTIEVARAAGLAADDQQDPPHWMPTERYDSWLSWHTGEQWVALVTAWLDLPRLPSIADERTQVLSVDRDRRAVPVLRRQVLDALASAPVGTAPSAEAIRAVLDFRQPRRSGELLAQTVTATLREAADLGLTGAGALSAAARALLGPRPDGPAEQRARDRDVTAALRAALPEDLDHVLIQADLTMVAPGPLVAHTARTLRLLADVESRGHATVYRISEASLRRALDAGWDAVSITTMLTDISRTPVPQPLAYLIEDVARRHGTVRVGHAFGYVRCDNPETLAAILGDRRLSGLGLHRIADTVLVSERTTPDVIATLRTAGYAPAAEDHAGQVLIRRPEDHRVPAPRTPRASTRRAPQEALVTAAVRTLRAADRTSRQPRGTTTSGPAAGVDLPRLSTTAIVSRLRAAVNDTRPVWIGYADNDGSVTEQIVDPIRVTAGTLTAFDHRTEQVRAFSVSRITGVADLLPEQSADPGI